MAVISSRTLFGNASDPVYSLLDKASGGIVLDVGASDGHKSELILDRSPEISIVAVEPFPRNVELMRKRLGGDPRVTIIAKAVAEKTGKATFTVPSTVKTDGPRKAGYSSVGYIAEKALETSESNIEVEVTTIDHLLGGDRALLMKVDVQGGELNVLRGADKAISDHRIDIIFAEYSGSIAMLEFLERRGYIVFDTKYLIIPRPGADLSDWDLINPHPFMLSIGKGAHHAWPKSMPKSHAAYAEMFKKQHESIGFTQTDLIAVSPHKLVEFMKVAMDVFGD